MRQKIPNSVVPFAYEISKRIYHKELTFTEGRNLLALEASMNVSSAGDYINNYKYLITGFRLTRTLNAYSMEYYLEQILKDNGIGVLSNAVSALGEHIDYYEATRKSKLKMRKMRNVHIKYAALLTSEHPDEQEQNEIVNHLRNENISKEKLLEQLRSVKETDPDIVIIKGKSFKRNNHIVAQIKLLRDFKCQFCGITIKKKDGTNYIEAAHIKPKYLKGCETLNNIILLCPNHHKEFDLGDTIVNYSNDTSVKITVNGQSYKIAFEVEEL